MPDHFVDPSIDSCESVIHFSSMSTRKHDTDDGLVLLYATDSAFD